MKKMICLLVLFLLLFTACNSRPKVVAQDKKHLIALIQQELQATPVGKVVDLNFIDVSQITDMRNLFDPKENIDLQYREIDISDWAVSKVTDMGFMFSGSQFNGDISKWCSKNKKACDKENLYRSTTWN